MLFPLSNLDVFQAFTDPAILHRSKACKKHISSSSPHLTEALVSWTLFFGESLPIHFSKEFFIVSVRKSRLLLMTLLFFMPALCFAHPHMSLTASCRFVWTGNKLSGVCLDWGFDPYFSADIINGYDVDKNGSFDKKETEEVYKNVFSNLKNYHYFTFIRQGSERGNPNSMSDFSVYRENKTIHYRFFIDLSKYAGELYLAVYDYSYFCAIDYPKDNPVSFDCDPTLVKPSFEIVENKKYPVYYDPYGAIDDTTVHYTWKKGLLTFYPREIHLEYAVIRP